jgi:hypothetical protein
MLVKMINLGDVLDGDHECTFTVARRRRSPLT